MQLPAYEHLRQQKNTLNVEESDMGNFNGIFFIILTNWKSSIISSIFPCPPFVHILETKGREGVH